MQALRHQTFRDSDMLKQDSLSRIRDGFKSFLKMGHLSVLDIDKLFILKQMSTLMLTHLQRTCLTVTLFSLLKHEVSHFFYLFHYDE